MNLKSVSLFLRRHSRTWVWVWQYMEKMVQLCHTNNQLVATTGSYAPKYCQILQNNRDIALVPAERHGLN